MVFKTISIIGLGYIGLPTAAMFASKQINVKGLDVREDVVDTINRGEIHIVEPHLDAMVKEAVTKGYLKASTTPQQSDAFLIAVPTPFKLQKTEAPPEPDLSYIKKAANSIATVLKKGDLVILESTSPVGTTEQLEIWLKEACGHLSFPSDAGNNADVNIAYCPERVLPGQVIKELVSNDRIIGGLSTKCSERAIDLYKIFVEGDCKITNARTAEMTKLTENSSRDVSIAFANELSIICDELDIDVWELISLSNLHPRVNILTPGPGVGGHCIAVDPWFIVSKTPQHSKLIHTARLINDNKPNWVIDKTREKIAEFLIKNPGRTLNDITIACFGLTFKPNIDDLRESPALSIAHTINNFHTGTIIAVEPNLTLENASNETGLTIKNIDYAIENADISVILVKHNEFTAINEFPGLIVDTVGISNKG